MKLLVKCTFTIPVEVLDPLENIYFHIEENGCPGTGPVGAALYAHMYKCEEEGVCWACLLEGENEIIQVLAE